MATVRPTVFLFDVDGTLITTGGAGRHALVRTFIEAFGRDDAFEGFGFGGMTDRQIVRTGLEAIGKTPTEVMIDTILVGYLEVLTDEVAKAQTYRLHDGMAEAIDTIEQTPHALGLGTGNLRDGARIKLDRLDLFGRFTFGGFGSDHEDRNTLIQIGAERGAKQLNQPLNQCRVVIVGDTPKDVAAAQHIGAESVTVATGSYTIDDLRAAGATHAFSSLAAPRALEILLG